MCICIVYLCFQCGMFLTGVVFSFNPESRIRKVIYSLYVLMNIICDGDVYRFWRHSEFILENEAFREKGEFGHTCKIS